MGAGAAARRPNGSAAWVLADHVRLLRTPWRIEVSTSSRTVTVRRAGKVARRFRAVVGAPGTPTPHGLFAVAERFDLASPNNFYGPHVLALTAFSNVFETFGGGPGVVGIHGRGGASLATPLGTAGSPAACGSTTRRSCSSRGSRSPARPSRSADGRRASQPSGEIVGSNTNPSESTRRTTVSRTNRDAWRELGTRSRTEPRFVCFVG